MGAFLFRIPVLLVLIFCHVALIEGKSCYKHIYHRPYYRYQPVRRGVWSSIGKLESRLDEPLKDWNLRLKFKEALAYDIYMPYTTGTQYTKGKTEVVLRPSYWTNILTNQHVFKYYAYFYHPTGWNGLKCAELCGTTTTTNRKICSEQPKSCLNNYHYRFFQQWYDRYWRMWRSRGSISPNLKYPLRNWKIKMEFKDYLAADIVMKNVQGQHDTKGKKTIFLTSLYSNQILNPHATFKYMVYFHRQQYKNHLRCVQFCGVRVDTNEDICQTITTTTLAPMTTTTPTRTTSTPTTTTTTPTTTTTNPTTTTTTPTTTTSNPTTTKSTPTTTTTTPSTTTTTPTTITTNPTTTTTTPTRTTTTQTTTTTTTTPSTSTTTPTTIKTAPTTTTTNPTTTTTASSTTTTPTKPKPCVPKYNYTEVITKSLLFYEAQRSGKLPDDQRVTWRKDSTLNDGSMKGVNLTGGYFDGAVYVKFGFPMSTTITNLAWGMLEFKKGYQTTGQYEYGLKALKWGTDYFIKCHPSPNKFYGQVGDSSIESNYWGRPEDMYIVRPVYVIDENTPGSDLAGETAAAMAATSMVFKIKGDLAYADTLLDHAKQLYTFAMKYRGLYQDSIRDAKYFYRSTSYIDELAWASLWLFKATNQGVYRNNFLTEFYKTASEEKPDQFSWDNKWLGVQVLGKQLSIPLATDWIDALKSLLKQPKLTPKGLFYVNQAGALRHAANLAFLARVAAALPTVSKDDRSFFNNFAQSQIHYILGDAGHSYVVGFGKNPPKRPFHKSSSCPTVGPCGLPQQDSTGPNPQILYGALVGGPDQNDHYTDIRKDYIKNEVTIDFNAGFQSALAGLQQLAEEGECEE